MHTARKAYLLRINFHTHITASAFTHGIVPSRHATATAPDTQIDGNSNNTDNWLHVLQVQDDGSVTEPDAPNPIQTSWLVPPRGIAVLRIN